MTVSSTEAPVFLVLLTLLGIVAGAAVGEGLDKYMRVVRSRVKFMAHHWTIGFALVPLLLFGIAQLALGRGPDLGAFVVGGLIGMLGHAAWDFRKWLRRRHKPES